MATAWVDDVRALVDDWIVQYEAGEIPGVVASPDVDGVLSILALRCWHKAPVRIVGVYTTTDLILCDGATVADARRALWVDHDVLGNVRSIGNHLLQLRADEPIPNRHPLSVNLNEKAAQSFETSFRGINARERDKYPFGTVHMLVHALLRIRIESLAERKPYHILFAWLAHADGTWVSSQQYRPSAKRWYDEFFCAASWLRYLFDNYLDDAQRFAQHKRVVDILSLGLGTSLQRSSSASLSARDSRLDRLPNMRWSELKGHQGPVNCTRWTLDGLNRSWRVAFNQLMLLASKAFGLGETELSLPTLFTDVVRGTVKTPNPDRWLAPSLSFSDTLRRERVFSLAFVSRRTVRYTVDLDSLCGLVPTVGKRSRADAFQSDQTLLSLSENDANFVMVVYDLETTGLHRTADRIVQMAFGVACLKTQRWLAEPRSHFINPEGRAVHERAREVHGIRDEHVSAARSFADVLQNDVCPMLMTAIGKVPVAVLVGYNNHRFDDAMLTNHLTRCGVALPPTVTHSLDLLTVLRQSKCVADVAASHKLGAVYEALFQRPLDHAHDAVADVQATFDVLMHYLVRKNVDVRQYAVPIFEK